MLQSGLRIRVGYPEFRHSAHAHVLCKMGRWVGVFLCAIYREGGEANRSNNQSTHSSISETNGSNPLKEERTKEGAEAP